MTGFDVVFQAMTCERWAYCFINSTRLRTQNSLGVDAQSYVAGTSYAAAPFFATACPALWYSPANRRLAHWARPEPFHCYHKRRLASYFGRIPT